MTIKDLAQKAKDFGIWIHFFNRKLYAELAKHITAEENILLIIRGHELKSTYKYPLIISDRAIYSAKFGLYGTVKHWVAPISAITNIFVGKAIFTYSLVISIRFEESKIDAIVMSRLSKETAEKTMEFINDLRRKNNSLVT